MKTVLVTGATGFIGRHALDPLVAREFRVHAVSSKRVTAQGPGITWHVADLCEPDAVRALLASLRPSHLLHFAWSVVPGGAAAAGQNFRWVRATLNLVENFTAVGGTRAVLAGSCAEYDWRFGYCVENLTPLAPRSYYGVCKHAARLSCEGFCEDLGVSLAWARIFFVYGPHEPLPRFVPSIVSALKQRVPAPCTHGAQLRDYLHVRDAADACAALLDSEVRGPVNIASGQPLRLHDMATHIARSLNGEDLLRMGARPAPPDDPPLLVGDVRRLTTEVGWRPRYNMQTGLDDTMAWWMNEPTPHPAGCLS